MNLLTFFKKTPEKPAQGTIRLPEDFKPYQDVWIQGHLFKSGKRSCARRYKLIYDCLRERYRPGFTLLDIGASEGYFSIRLAEDLQAHPTMLEKKRSLKLVASMQRNRDLRLQSGEISAASLMKQGQFDVIIALSIVHHFSDWGRIVKHVLSMGDTVIIELPSENERSTKRSDSATGMLNVLQWYQPKLIGETSGYAEEFKRQIYVVDFPALPHLPHLVKGVVTAGRSSSARQKKHYQGAVKELLGITLFPGTLNLVIDKKLYFKNAIKIDSEKGPYHLFPCKVEGIPSYIVKPPRAKNRSDSLEIFSEFHLREVFGLNDGDSILVELDPNHLGTRKEIEYAVKTYSSPQEEQPDEDLAVRP